MPVDTRPRTPLISFCTIQLRTLCAAHSLATLCLFTTFGPNPGELPGFWGFMVFRHAPIPPSLGRGRINNNKSFGELARWGALLAPSAILCCFFPLISFIHSPFFLGLEAYYLIKIPRHVGSLNFHRGTCASSSCSLCPLLSTLKQTQPTVRFFSL